MPRKARDERLDTRTARLRLPVRREPYWRSIQEGRALGYRRLGAGKAGTWIARHYQAATARRYLALGSADDLLDADGVDTLTFVQAQQKADEWFKTLARQDGKVAPEPLTVARAVEDYLADYTGRGGKALRDLQTAINAHILPPLGSRRVSDLTAEAIKRWHHALAAAPARLRSAAADEKPRRRSAIDANDKRARRATANRVLTILKAACNLAFRDGRVASDDPWRRVQPFDKVSAARVRYLTDEEAARLVNACPPDLRTLVTAALLTGCRYGELIALRASDINLAAGVLTVNVSKGGGARHVTLPDEARQFFGTLTAGQPASVLILTRADGQPWGKSHQFRPMRKACAAAGIKPGASFHVLRHTHASRLAMKGVPMAVITAQLGHSDVKITAKHYAHLAPGFVADTIRQAFGSLGIVPQTNVMRIGG